jgi:poly-gamma-glutamate capsule biosynthesis protein CapA/YwtB (metallophosphatase superfamily)
MTDEEFNDLVEACKPVPYMVIGGIVPESPTDKAMRVWDSVAKRVGCVQSSIAPANTGDDHDFMAEPKETNEPHQEVAADKSQSQEVP